MGKITERLKQGQILVSDGAWGTFLQKKGLEPGECPEEWNISHAEDVYDIAKSYIDAGADILMGHHPHTFQPYEAYKNGYIFYSLGGLTFGDYVKNDKLQSLFRKTKKAAVVSCDLCNMNLDFLPTKELEGNIIRLDNRDLPTWSRKKWKLYKIRNSHALMELLFAFQEKE